MKDTTPKFLSNLDVSKLQHYVLFGLQICLKNHQAWVRRSKIVMAKDVLCMLALSLQVCSGSTVVGLLGVDTRNISRAWSKQLIMGVNKNASWLHHIKKVQNNSLANIIKVTLQN